MQKVLIVEDEISQQSMLENTIHESFPLWTVYTAASFSEALELINNSISTKQLFSLFLLDIQLTPHTGDRGGFFLAKEIRKHSVYFRTPLLFLTAVSDENAFALSNFHCYNYISKPYTPEDILYQLQQMLLTGYLEQNILEIRDTFRMLKRIRLDEVLYIHAHSHTLTFYTDNATISSREYSLSSLPDKLGTNFIRCHKSYIINLNYAKNLDKSSLYIDVQNKQLPIGKQYLTELELAYNRLYL